MPGCVIKVRCDGCDRSCMHLTSNERTSRANQNRETDISQLTELVKRHRMSYSLHLLIARAHRIHSGSAFTDQRFVPSLYALTCPPFRSGIIVACISSKMFRSFLLLSPCSKEKKLQCSSCTHWHLPSNRDQLASHLYHH